MAKVMISIPDALLERVDLRARTLGESRSGLLQRLAEREVEDDAQRRSQEVKRLMAKIEGSFTADEPAFDAARLVREDRDSR